MGQRSACQNCYVKNLPTAMPGNDHKGIEPNTTRKAFFLKEDYFFPSFCTHTYIYNYIFSCTFSCMNSLTQWKRTIQRTGASNHAMSRKQDIRRSPYEYTREHIYIATPFKGFSVTRLLYMTTDIYYYSTNLNTKRSLEISSLKNRKETKTTSEF